MFSVWRKTKNYQMHGGGTSYFYFLLWNCRPFPSFNYGQRWPFLWNWQRCYFLKKRRRLSVSAGKGKELTAWGCEFVKVTCRSLAVGHSKVGGLCRVCVCVFRYTVECLQSGSKMTFNFLDVCLCELLMYKIWRTHQYDSSCFQSASLHLKMLWKFIKYFPKAACREMSIYFYIFFLF